MSKQTGNLTLPLCDLEIWLTGSDLIEGSRSDAGKRRRKMGFMSPCASDFRILTECLRQRFDWVASTGNSLPRVNNAELIVVLEQMDALIKPGGWL